MPNRWKRRVKLTAICICIGIISVLLLMGWALAANMASQAPGVELGPDHTRQAEEGETVLYNHILTNTGTMTDTFLLEVLSTQGWPVKLLSEMYPDGTVLLPLQVGSQVTASFQVSLTVPLDIAGVTEITVITATSQLSPTIQASASDTTIVYSRVYLPMVARNPIPPSFHDIFPEGTDGQGIWSNAGFVDPDYDENGWFCPGKPPGDYDCGDRVAHIDIGLPNQYFDGQDPVILAPAPGEVIVIFDPGEGLAMEIRLSDIPNGLENLLANQSEIDYLSHDGAIPFDYTIDDVDHVSYLLAHTENLQIEEGDHVDVGQHVADVKMDNWGTPKVAHVLKIRMNDGKRYDFNPCLLNESGGAGPYNIAQFCGICAEGAQERGMRCP